VAFDANKPLLCSMRSTMPDGRAVIDLQQHGTALKSEQAARQDSEFDLAFLAPMIDSLRPSSLVNVANASGELSTGDFESSILHSWAAFG